MNPLGPLALGLLTTSLEAADSRFLAADLAPGTRGAFDLLRDHGAVVPGADIAAVLCPWCGEHDVAPQRRAGTLQGLCPDCGYVAIGNSDLKAWQADVSWVLTRLRGAFGIATRQTSRELVENMLWQVGEPTVGKRKRRILFTRRLADRDVQQRLRPELEAAASGEGTLLIGTTAPAIARLEGLPLLYRELTALVHWRSGALVLNNECWEHDLRTLDQPPRQSGRDGFFDHYRRAVIDGEEFRFSVMQAQVFEYLDQAGGEKCHKDSIMATIESTQKNPAELFRSNPKQREGFQRLVAHDDHGYYWLQGR